MKTSFILTAICIVSLSFFLFWKFETTNHDTSVTVSDNEDAYSFSARYDPENTGKVERYVNRCISPNRLGNSDHDYIDANTSLPDNTRFYVKEEPGLVKIELDKKRNSTASYYRIKKMCEGIKNLLAGK